MPHLPGWSERRLERVIVWLRRRMEDRPAMYDTREGPPAAAPGPGTVPRGFADIDQEPGRVPALPV